MKKLLLLALLALIPSLGEAQVTCFGASCGSASGGVPSSIPSGTATDCTALSVWRTSAGQLLECGLGLTYSNGVIAAGTASSLRGGLDLFGATHAFSTRFQVSESQGAGITYTLPTTDGGASEFLQTNGSGALTWAAVSSTITSGTTATSGCVAGGVLYSISNLVKCDGNFTFDNNILTVGNVTTAGRSTIKLQDTVSGASATSNFLNITGTFPATLSATTSAVNVTVVGDNDTQIQNGINISLTGAGHGSSPASHGLYALNSSEVAGGYAYALRGSTVGLTGGNSYAISGEAGNSVRSVGVNGSAGSGSFSSFGVVGRTTGTTNAVGVMGFVGDPGDLGQYGTAAIMGSNLANATNIMVLMDSTTPVLTVADGGATWWKIGSKALVDATPTAFVRVAVASNGRQGGLLEYCVDADDATNYQTRCGSVPFSFINEAGAETCTIGTPADVLGGAGTLTVAFTGTAGTNTCDINGDAASSLVETTLRINYTVRLFGNAATAVTAQ